MVIKLWRMAPNHKLIWHLDHVRSGVITWETRSIIFPLSQFLWPPNLVKWWLNLSDSPPSHKYWTFDEVVLQDHMTNQHHYIYTTTVPMTTKFDRVVTYYEEVQLTKLFDPSNTWFCEITWQIWQIKNFISLLALSQWPPTFTPEFTKFFEHVIIWSHEIN